MLDTSTHTLEALFLQLGLPNSPEEIDAFIQQHRPLPDGLLLSQADFWTQNQATFLREAILKDADWAVVVDELSVRFRE